MEPVSGVQHAMGGHFVRTIGSLRVRVKIGMMNLAYSMWKYIFTLLAMLISVCGAVSAHAAGTPAGTVISNQVMLGYSLEGIPQVIASNTATFTVAEIINVSLVWQDAAPVAVNSPDTSRALTLLLTNTGNGSEAYSLIRNNSIAGDQFDSANAAIGAIFLENGLAPDFQGSGPNADTLYIPGTNDPTLAADASRVIYLVSDIPSLVLRDTGQASLNAAALTAGASGAAPGATLAGLGTGGVDALVGASRATATAVGSYVVSGLAVIVSKLVSRIQAPPGVNPDDLVMPGSVLTYRITLSVSGSGTANDLAFNDPLPAETDFVAGSITVNGAVRSDMVDADNANFNVIANTINVIFGNTVAPVIHLIEFRGVVM